MTWPQNDSLKKCIIVIFAEFQHRGLPGCLVAAISASPSQKQGQKRSREIRAEKSAGKKNKSVAIVNNESLECLA